MNEEPVQIVDDNNQPVGVAPRWRMRCEGLLHRATCIVVCNRAGEVFVQRRSMEKDLYPGWYDLCAGGVMRPGESYQENAERELAEELGVAGVPLLWRGEFLFRAPGYQVWVGLFGVRHEGPFEFADGEVDEGFFAHPAAIDEGAISPLTPDGLAAFERYRLT
jgi:8-oxo-dGTP pyrophosphatase MutT (NUDIX family)